MSATMAVPDPTAPYNRLLRLRTLRCSAQPSGLRSQAKPKSRAPARAAPTALGGEQVCDVSDCFSIYIECESIRVHAEPLMVELFLSQNSSTSGSAFYAAGVRNIHRCPIRPKRVGGITSLSIVHV